ncbi:MAG: hypothetical protein ABSD42_14170 [Candidatus Bathyarchaeia archaeon]|jgi:starch phosphorylase
MEIGINSDVPTYSGGIGVLAGDVIPSKAGFIIPLVAHEKLIKFGRGLMKSTSYRT